MAISARIDELKKKFDENPRRYFASLANEYRKAGDLDQALFICQEYLPQQPAHMSGHIVLAQTLYEMGRLPDAKSEFEAALALDPENLIALRHLGDIARQSGDPRTARNWYQRVLEADPRNAEIVDVLATLRTTPMASAAAIPPTPLSSGVIPPPTPLSSAVVPPTPLSTPVMPPPPPPPVEHVEPPTEEHELLDFESISLGGTPLLTPAVGADEAEGVSEMAMPVEQSAPDLELEADTFEPDAFAVAAPELSEAPADAFAETPEPPIEPATDIELGLIDDEFVPAAEDDIEPTTLEGLRSYEAGTLMTGDASIDKSLDTESYYDVLHGTGRTTPAEPAAATTPPSDEDFAAGYIEHDADFGVAEQAASVELPVEAHEITETPSYSAAPVEGLESFEDDAEAEFTLPSWSTPHSASPVDSSTPVVSSTPTASETPVASATPVESTEPIAEAPSESPARGATPQTGSEIFVTETMADLYLSQGHTDSALDIYRKLLEQRPDDARLMERVRDAEARLSGRTSRIATPALAAEAPAPRGPTIREFLVAIVGAKPIASDFADRSWDGAAHDSLGSDETVSGSIDALFPATDVAPHDSEPASALAEAFADSGESDSELGRPAHPASSELSLDQVFKSSTPVRSEAQPDGFSFDQFFSGEANSSSASPPNPNAPPAEGTDDIAQFNAWLNGLKKT